MSNTIVKYIITLVNNPHPCHRYMFITENYSSKFVFFWTVHNEDSKTKDFSKTILFLQPSQLPTAKGNCLRYCHQRENHRQQIFAVNIYLQFAMNLPLFCWIRSFLSYKCLLLRKHSTPDYFTWSISFPFILDFNTLWWSEQYCRF